MEEELKNGNRTIGIKLLVYMKGEYFTFSEIKEGKCRGSGSSRDLEDIGS